MPLVARGEAAVSVFGIDYAWSHPSVSAMRSAGVKFVCRYLSHDASKDLSRGEADRLSEAGIWIVVVWETTANRALSGRAGGVADAQDAARQAAACGMPGDRPIYFAVDWDASASQQATINAYLDGAASVIGRDRVGMYAGYGPIKRAFDAGKITYGWQTYAWSAGRWDSRAHIQQYRNGVRVGGADCDYDRAMKSDYGQWRVGVTGGDDMPLTNDDVKKIWQSDFLEAPKSDETGDYLNPDNPDWRPDSYLRESYLFIRRIHKLVGQLAARDAADVDEDAIAAAVLAGLTPEKIAAAIPAEIAEQVVDAIGARLNGG